MAAIRLAKMALTSENPALFTEAMTWELAFEVSETLPDPIDIVFSWAADVGKSDKDIVLDELEVGPFALGINQVAVECDAPDFSLLDEAHVLDDTCITVSFRYHGQEFLHAGFQVRVSWRNPAHEVEIPDVVTAELLQREVFVKQHRSTRDIDWGLGKAVPPSQESSGSSSDEGDEDEEEEEDEEEGEQPGEASAAAVSGDGNDDDDVPLSQRRPPQPRRSQE